MKKIRNEDGLYFLMELEHNSEMYRVQVGTDYSNWFDSDTKDRLMRLKRKAFIKECEGLVELRHISEETN